MREVVRDGLLKAEATLLLEFGCLLLEFGCLLLEFGCLLLEFGCLLLEFGCLSTQTTRCLTKYFVKCAYSECNGVASAFKRQVVSGRQ